VRHARWRATAASPDASVSTRPAAALVFDIINVKKVERIVKLGTDVR
jgi:hypothetical protein